MVQPVAAVLFFPVTDTVYSAGCLNDINSLMSSLMEERKKNNGSYQEEIQNENR